MGLRESTRDAPALLHVVFEPPPGKYLLALPMFAYNAAFTTIGVAHWLPYRLASIALTILVAGLFFILAARRVGYLVALPAAVLIMFLGSGAEVTATALRMPEQIALAAGLGMLLAFERHDLRGDIFACLLLLVSITSHPMGTAFLAAAAVLVLARPAPQRWQGAWVFVVPGALFAAWYLTLRSPAPGASLGHEVRDIPRFEAQSLSADARRRYRDLPIAFERHTRLPDTAELPPGGRGVRGNEPQGADPAASRVLGAPGGGLGVVRGARLRPWHATHPAVLALHPARGGDAPLLLSEAARGLSINNGRVRLAVAAVIVVVFAFSIYSNATVLKQHAATWAGRGVQDRAELTALDLARSTVSPSFRPEDPAGQPPIPLTHVPIAAYNYFAIEREFGSPAYQPSKLDALPAATRRVVDVVLARALRLQLEPAGSLPSARGDQPRVIATTAAKRNVGRGCLTLVPNHRARVDPNRAANGWRCTCGGTGTARPTSAREIWGPVQLPLEPIAAG